MNESPGAPQDAGGDGRRAALPKWLSAAPPLLTIFGIVLYGAEAAGYGRFYQDLNVTPDDVGLTYVTTLTRSSGLIVIVALLALTGFISYLRVRKFIGEVETITLATLALSKQLGRGVVLEEAKNRDPITQDKFPRRVRGMSEPSNRSFRASIDSLRV